MGYIQTLAQGYPVAFVSCPSQCELTTRAFKLKLNSIVCPRLQIVSDILRIWRYYGIANDDIVPQRHGLALKFDPTRVIVEMMERDPGDMDEINFRICKGKMQRRAYLEARSRSSCNIFCPGILKHDDVQLKVC